MKAGGRLETYPDRRVQKAIRLVFAKAAKLGSVRRALLRSHERGLDLPTRRRNGSAVRDSFRHGKDGFAFKEIRLQ
ncbi:MAG: hypothetical protein ACREC6_03010 [Hyphomicrobiaceae bacterium]